MKTARIFATLLVFIAPSLALAFTAQSGESLNITAPVSDDLYVAWARVSVQSPITGDLIMAGSDLSSEGNVSESLMIAGANIDISSVIGDDLRAAGANIRVRSAIVGDAVIAGGNIDIKKEAKVGKDLIVVAGNIYLDGIVNGKADITAGKVYLNGIIEKDAHIRAQEIVVGSGAKILGNLQYESVKANPTLESIVSWAKQFSEQKSWDKKKGEKELRNGVISFLFSYILLKILFLTVFGFLLYSFMRKYIHETSDILTESPWTSLFVGISFFILVPITALLLAFTLIGIPVAALMMTVLVFIFIFYELIGTVVFSSWVMDRYLKGWKDSWWRKLVVIFGFAFVFGVISGIDIVFAWMAIGALLTRHWKLIESVRK